MSFQYFYMNNRLLLLINACLFSLLFACKPTSPIVEFDDYIDLDTISIKSNSELDIYRESDPKTFDLLHTKLEVSFDWDSTYLYGKAFLSLSPYFYPQSSLVLDAKGFQIKEVAQLDDLGIKTPLLYSYDSLELKIELGKPYTKTDTLRLFIDYVAMPNKLKQGGSAAITKDIGLYFINPDGSEANKPRQIWTQGETEASSCWFPTIDSPNEKTTQEIFITVDSIYSTLSNGTLLFQTENSDGTRTDYWKQDLPHAPYLFMMAIGEYAIVKDSWNDIEVNYYVEPEFEAFAKDIFPNTVEMLSFFSEKMKYPYPWDKYDQVVVRDYVSGAMENTSAVIYGEFVQGNDRFLIDNAREDIVAHELFHHWFGDLVTCESWSNLPLNESFATYGEFLWFEYKYGPDKAQLHLQKDLKAYLRESRLKQEKLIRFHYLSQEEMFDAHSYQKGGRVLHMLRNLIGDEAFFKVLNIYLKEHEYSSTEIHHLRLICEKVTGLDLNWFFNQWFFEAGHPSIDVKYHYADSTKTLYFTTEQTQNYNIGPYAYRIPTNIEILKADGEKLIQPIEITKRTQTFEIPLNHPPHFAKLDANNDLLAEINQDIPSSEAMNLFLFGENYLDRYDAIDMIAEKADSIYLDLIELGLNDPFWNIRKLALKNCNKLSVLRADKTLEKLRAMALNDPNSKVRAEAFEAIADNYNNIPIENLKAGLEDRSYLVLASSLETIYSLDSKEGIEIAKGLEKDNNKDLQVCIARIYAEDGKPEHQSFFLNLLKHESGSTLYSSTMQYREFLLKQDDKIIKEALPTLKKIAKEEDAWWVRLGGVYSIVDLYYHYEEENKSIDNQLSISSDEKQILKLEDRQREIISMQGLIRDNLKVLKNSETENNVIQIINQVVD